jgi:lipopolysaccharide transport system permease protein
MLTGEPQTEPQTKPPRVSNERRIAVPGVRRARVSDLWRSWEIALVVASRDLKIKYKQSLLGPPWLVLQPLGMLAALIVAYHGVANVSTGGVPYVPFALTGLATWTLVQMTLVNGTMSFLQNALLIRRVPSPRIAFVTGSVLANLPAPAVVLAGAIASLLISGQGLPLQALMLPFVAAWILAFTYALVCISASLVVRFRDIQSLIPFWSQVGLFLTPVGFALASAPGRTQDVLTFNPLSGLFEVTRWCLLDTPLEALPVVVSAAFTMVLLFGGWQIFSRLEITFADVI